MKQRQLQSQQGQIMVLFALSLVGILALIGAVLDGGNIYIQRRTAQNAADAAAIAGARALVKSLASPTTTITAEICKYAIANAFGVQPTPTAYFVGTDGVTNKGAIAVPATCTGTNSDAVAVTIPSGAAGIHVDVSIPFFTVVPRLIGMTNVTARASATAQVGAVSGIAAAAAPVAACGVMMDNGGTDPNIFVGGIPSTIDYATYMNANYILQGSQLWKDSQNPPCPKDNGNANWKGTIGPGGAITVPSNQPTVGGNSAAPLDTACTSAGQGDPTAGGTCYLGIPITDGNNPTAGVAHIVGFACMQVFAGGNGTNRWNGTIVNPANCATSSVYSYSFNWTWSSGTYTFGRIGLTN